MVLGNLLDASAHHAPETPALICGDTAVTHRQLNHSSTALALRTIQQGLRPGDRVAIHWANSVEIATLYFACFKAGLIAVPVNIRLKPVEVEYVLRHSEASICFSQPRLSPVAEEGIAIGRLAIPLRSELPCDDLSSGTLPEIAACDPAAILYTSGTTAHPKGATHTHASLSHAARLMLRMVAGSGPVGMTTTQMTHMSGLAAFLLTSVLDCKTLVVLPAFDPALALDTIERFRVTYTGALPMMLALLVDEQIRRPLDVGSLRTSRKA